MKATSTKNYPKYVTVANPAHRSCSEEKLAHGGQCSLLHCLTNAGLAGVQEAVEPEDVGQVTSDVGHVTSQPQFHTITTPSGSNELIQIINPPPLGPRGVMDSSQGLTITDITIPVLEEGSVVSIPAMTSLLNTPRFNLPSNVVLLQDPVYTTDVNQPGERFSSSDVQVDDPVRSRTGSVGAHFVSRHGNRRRILGLP